ncbi:MFS transporter [Chlorogloeopsis sp. ULAP01]|uniref:MFS transporter n=1 Tax=Chlorogloeopsis sp. ULAP01 TaxID=3056483 RepID=UPI0025AB341C|nr:MFS transporter [Chlorogloeopsis sp. ULAP01]MDM9382025.1 MFS transporter [Chlorogloeopsis sp. ULAP01]
MAKCFAIPQMWVFIFIWFGQLVSLIGSGLTGFALGVWVYQRTGSVTQFALISLFTTLPGILVSPLAGVLIDRWDRRWAMILSDSGAALSTFAIALLLLAGRLEVWQIYLASAVSSAFSAFQWPAYVAATTLLVPKQQLGRASGMVQLAEATAQILSPAIAGVLVGQIQVEGVILIDFATFVFSLFTLLSVRFPSPKTTTNSQAGKSSLLQEASYGWSYISDRLGLLSLLIFIAAVNFLTGIVSVLVTPLALAFTSVAMLGQVLTTGGCGMLVGSLVVSVWGNFKRPIYAVFSFTLLGGLAIFLAGFKPLLPVFFVTAFVYFFGLPIINSASQVIWQKKVAPEVQGRVFAVRRAIAWAALPLAYPVAGVLADKVFEPLLAVNGALAGNVGQVIGIGKGYGIALLFVVIGTLTVVLTVAGYLYPRLRLVEEELPDAIADPLPVIVIPEE